LMCHCRAPHVSISVTRCQTPRGSSLGKKRTTRIKEIHISPA